MMLVLGVESQQNPTSALLFLHSHSSRTFVAQIVLDAAEEASCQRSDVVVVGEETEMQLEVLTLTGWMVGEYFEPIQSNPQDMMKMFFCRLYFH